MPSEDSNLSDATILFTDLCRSTELYERLGDHQAHAVVRIVMASLAGSAEGWGGRLIKEIGDEIMCAFPTCESAVQAALEMHHELDSGSLSEYEHLAMALLSPARADRSTGLTGLHLAQA